MIRKTMVQNPGRTRDPSKDTNIPVWTAEELHFRNRGVINTLTKNEAQLQTISVSNFITGLIFL